MGSMYLGAEAKHQPVLPESSLTSSFFAEDFEAE